MIPISISSQEYASEVRQALRAARVQVDVDNADKTMQKKVFEAQVAQYNYILVRPAAAAGGCVRNDWAVCEGHCLGLCLEAGSTVLNKIMQNTECQVGQAEDSQDLLLLRPYSLDMGCFKCCK